MARELSFEAFQQRRHVLALDGLRALAVTAVVVQHYQILVGGAGYGVHLFFVLSGFLITGILLVERKNVARGVPRTRAFRQFYIRRLLRIFPLYYFVVLVGIALNASYAREYAPWLLTYTINLKMAAQGWYIANFAHFWSLAIEEQYYLVWPWLILLLPRRWLIPSAVITTAIGPLFRLFLIRHQIYGDTWLAGYIATPTALDSLGMGSLIAILMRTESTAERLRRWVRWPVALVSLALVIVLNLLWATPIHFVLLDTASAVFFGWVIYRASQGFGGLAGAFLAAAPIVFIGRISYGIYVYHPLVPTVVAKVGGRFGLQPLADNWRSGLFYSALTLFAATISWYALERPITQLKRKFPYVSRATPA